MTKEQLRNTIAMMVGESPSEPGSLTIELLALFDRFEAEQWSKPGEAPSGSSRDVLMYTPTDGMIVFAWNPGAKWFQFESWRELPAPPKEESSERP